MAAKLEKTRTPGVYRRGGRYVFSYRDADGKQRWESCRTVDEARRARAARQTDVVRGEAQERSRVTLHEYARGWVGRYQGRGRRGFRDNTRDEYARVLERFVFVYFPERLRLAEITPKTIAEFIGWLCDPQEQGRRAATDRRRAQADKLSMSAAMLPLDVEPLALSDSTVKNVMKPLRGCLASAVREGVIRINPAREVDLPHRPAAEDADGEEVKAMSREELATLLALIPEDWRTFFWFLAATGVRISEAIALQWGHLDLNGSTPHVKVRRALVKGRMGPPKSKYGRRDVPLAHPLVLALREHRKGSEWPDDDHLVFTAGNGSPLMPGNVRRRVLEPARDEACLGWVGFHAFRHTCASLLFAEGRNAVQVQRWLGHHSAAFTLATYVHLLDGDIGAPLDVCTSVRTPATESVEWLADEAGNPHR